MIVVLVSISAVSDGEVSVLIGGFSSRRLIGLAITAALMSLAIGLCVIAVPRIWLLLLVPARLVAIAATCMAALVSWIGSSATVVSLVSEGCETGYVVEEDSFLLAGWGTVYRADGVFVTPVERTLGDDGYRPFSVGAYAVTSEGDTHRVWYSIVNDPSATPVSTGRAPDFSLPVLSGRDLTCGISAGARTPVPTPPDPPEYEVEELQKHVQDMVRASIAAAVGSAVDAEGQPVSAQSATVQGIVCGVDGTRVGLTLDFRTADNAESLTRILHAWDTAGYLPDRAMQEDIRYSETLPIEKMSIRDSGTIDGLIHMTVTSRCVLDDD
ncbi:hypothetical protein QL996_13325 [Planococcus sp. APC 4015]|nr:hypothetical protein [Planococcus sp. APC 4015]